MTNEEGSTNVIRDRESRTGKQAAHGSDSVGERTEQGSRAAAGCQNCGDPRAMYVRYRTEKSGANLCPECDKSEILKRVLTDA